MIKLEKAYERLSCESAAAFFVCVVVENGAGKWTRENGPLDLAHRSIFNRPIFPVSVAHS